MMERIEKAIYQQNFSRAKDGLDSISPGSLDKDQKAQYYFLSAKYEQNENNNIRKAKRMYESSIEANPTNIYARKAKNNLGNIFSWEGDERGARRLWEEAGCAEYAKPYTNLSASYNNELVRKEKSENTSPMTQERIIKKIIEYDRKVISYQSECTQEDISKARDELLYCENFLADLKRDEQREYEDCKQSESRRDLREITKNIEELKKAIEEQEIVIEFRPRIW